MRFRPSGPPAHEQHHGVNRSREPQAFGMESFMAQETVDAQVCSCNSRKKSRYTPIPNQTLQAGQK